MANISTLRETTNEWRKLRKRSSVRPDCSFSEVLEHLGAGNDSEKWLDCVKRVLSMSDGTVRELGYTRTLSFIPPVLKPQEEGAHFLIQDSWELPLEDGSKVVMEMKLIRDEKRPNPGRAILISKHVSDHVEPIFNEDLTDSPIGEALTEAATNIKRFFQVSRMDTFAMRKDEGELASVLKNGQIKIALKLGD